MNRWQKLGNQKGAANVALWVRVDAQPLDEVARRHSLSLLVRSDVNDLTHAPVALKRQEREPWNSAPEPTRRDAP